MQVTIALHQSRWLRLSVSRMILCGGDAAEKQTEHDRETTLHRGYLQRIDVNGNSFMASKTAPIIHPSVRDIMKQFPSSIAADGPRSEPALRNRPIFRLAYYRFPPFASAAHVQLRGVARLSNTFLPVSMWPSLAEGGHKMRHIWISKVLR
jgi:hypothetical protein